MASDIVLRSLSSPAELDAWFDLCATAFAAKGTPRSHFEAHWRDDPFSDLAGVFVADASSGADESAESALVSSVRVFARHIHLGGRVVSMGGIGEVGTRPSHAGRGLATRLLGLALDRMAERRVDVAALHSSHVRAPPGIYFPQVGFLIFDFIFLCLSRATCHSVRRPRFTKSSAGYQYADSSR